MAVPKSNHELNIEAAERDEYWRGRAAEARRACVNECPAGRYLDREHLLDMLSQLPSTNRPYLAWAYLAVHGARALSVPTRPNERPFRLTADTLEQFINRDVWWDPPPSMLEGLPQEYRSSIVGAR